MSATDYRQMVEARDGLVGVECADGVTVRIDLFGDDDRRLTATELRDLIDALNGAYSVVMRR